VEIERLRKCVKKIGGEKYVTLAHDLPTTELQVAVESIKKLLELLRNKVVNKRASIKELETLLKWLKEEEDQLVSRIEEANTTNLEEAQKEITYLIIASEGLEAILNARKALNNK